MAVFLTVSKSKHEMCLVFVAKIPLYVQSLTVGKYPSSPFPSKYSSTRVMAFHEILEALHYIRKVLGKVSQKNLVKRLVIQTLFLRRKKKIFSGTT